MGGQVAVPQALADLTGKVAVVTGGNAGIGFETAKALAGMGARTFIACRSETRATEAIQRMREEVERESPGKQLNIEYMSLDLSSLLSTKQFAAAFKERHLPLHILVNNAGIGLSPTPNSDDGYNIHYQVNHLGHFLLTLELLPVIVETAGASGDVRIVFVSSRLHSRGVFNPANMNMEAGYSQTQSYANSKVYNVMTSIALQRRLKSVGVTVSAVHPGAVMTEIYNPSTPIKMLVSAGNYLHIVKSPPRGALSSINCAANPSLNSQQAFYYNADGNQVLPSEVARNEFFQEHLWEISVDAVRTHLSPEVLQMYGEAQRTTQSATVEGGSGGNEPVEQQE